MVITNRSLKALALSVCPLVLVVAGCGRNYVAPAPTGLGTLSDPVWQNQEANAEHSDFVVYQHEFRNDTEFLNTDGEDHVKQIAARLLSGQDSQVVVERSMMSPRADTEYQYPVHPNPKLDMRRREIIVRSLAAMGINDAEERVVVAPAFDVRMTGNEATAAYQSGMSGGQYGARGMGGFGGFGGFMFGGGF